MPPWRPIAGFKPYKTSNLAEWRLQKGLDLFVFRSEGPESLHEQRQLCAVLLPSSLQPNKQHEYTQA
jgi:hypothetical protein